MTAAQFFWPLFSVSTLFEFAGTRFRHPQTAIFVCYICFARAPKFRAHFEQAATAQISKVWDGPISCSSDNSVTFHSVIIFHNSFSTSTVAGVWVVPHLFVGRRTRRGLLLFAFRVRVGRNT